MTPPLLSVEEAHARLIRLFAPLNIEEISLEDAAGRVLARDVAAARDQPPFPASAMDGYAVRAADLVPGARLAVTGASLAGAGFAGRVGPGEAVRIFTGAPVPEGADRILIQEDADREGDSVTVRADADPGPYIRPAGGDFRAGHRLAAPRRLCPAEVALLASMNIVRVPVRRRPVVALIPTGDELVAPGEAPARDQIVSANNYGLKALLESAGAEARLLPIARDTPESLSATLALAEGADLIVTLGGASVGDFDLVRATALGHGLELDFHRIAMRPGKPLIAGRLGATPFVGLPGNPVSALVTGLIFLRPAVSAMLGLGAGRPVPIPGRLAAAVPENGPRMRFLHAVAAPGPEGWRCDPSPRQDSSLLSAFAESNALVLRAPHAPAADAGELVDFLFIS